MIKRILCCIVFTAWANCCLGDILLQKDYHNPLADDPAHAQVKVGSLDYKFHNETGGKLWVKDYDHGVRYALNSSIINHQANPVLYLSFCLRSLNESTQNKYAGIMFYDKGREVFGLGNDFGSENFAFWGDNGNSYPIGEVKTKIDSEIHKIIVKIEFNAEGPEDITVGLDPFCGRSEARQPRNIWTKYQAELNFDELRIRCGNDDCTWEFDELRIGTNWESVTPANDNPGSDYKVYGDNSLPEGPKEMIAENVARFWPFGVNQSETQPSLALASPRSAIGQVDGVWQLKPEFGSYDNKKYAYFNIPADTDLYGTGEVTGGLLRNGYKIRLFNKDNGAYGEPDRLYQAHPWVMGVRPDGTAFGIIFDSTWISELNLRSGILFTVPDYAPSFPVIVIEEQTPQAVMIKLGELTGNMPLPPRWALGYQQCRFSYVPDSRAREVADTFRNKQIPCDVIWFDIDYMDGFRIFTFDASRYPDPKGTNDYLHSKGFKGIWMIDPGVKKEDGYFVYDSGTAADAWVKDASGNPFFGPVWPGDSVFPDFTCPDASNWWSGLYKDYMAKGIDGVWNDMNEPTVFGLPDMTMPMDCQFRGGGDLLPGTHEQYHNVYGMLMTRASRKGIQDANPDKRPFVLTRSNYLGGQRYAATWTGDNMSIWQHMVWSIPMSLNLSLSGQPFNGPDIGGFLSNADADLFGNWMALGAFYPFSRGHTCAGTADHEPWSFGQEVEDSSRTSLQRRYRLMPYLYSVFQESSKNGLPIMRPMFFADASDMALRLEEQAFMVGQDLMVIPRWAQNTAQPKGIWQDITIVDEDLSKDKYQCEMKQRGGSIMPLGPIVQSTVEIQTQQKLTLNIVLDEHGKASGSLYEDTGDGYEYLEGQYCLSNFTAERSGDTVIVKCTSQQGELAQTSRMVSITIIGENGVHFGYGDILSNDGVSVKLTLTARWNSQDIGTVGIAGGAGGDGNNFTITGSGADIEGGSDEFHFSYKKLSGDCEITSRVVSQQNTNSWAKAGVMIREDLTASSAHAMTVMTPGNGVAFQRRTTADANGTSHTGVSGVESPEWVRVKRSGNNFTGSYSNNGIDWININSETIVMGNTIYLGLAVTSHNASSLSTVNFDNVSCTMDAVSVDRNSDGIVNLYDFSRIAEQWYLNTSAGNGDINGDNMVNEEDVFQLANTWLQ